MICLDHDQGLCSLQSAVGSLSRAAVRNSDTFLEWWVFVFLSHGPLCKTDESCELSPHKSVHPLHNCRIPWSPLHPHPPRPRLDGTCGWCCWEVSWPDTSSLCRTELQRGLRCHGMQGRHGMGSPQGWLQCRRFGTVCGSRSSVSVRWYCSDS